MLDSCGSKCLKYFLAIFNFLFFAGGLTLAGIAGYEAFSKNSMLNRMIVSLDAPILKDGLYILMAVGLMLAMISFFGCWGALSENKCLLVSYFVFILVIFILQLAGIIISLVKYKQIKSVMISDLKMKTPNQVAKLYDTALGLVETKFHCCGITGPSNYAVIPPTCYAPAPSRARRAAGTDVSTEAAPVVTTHKMTTKAPTTTASAVPMVLYEQGCETAIRPYLYAAGGIAIGILLLEILVMLFACCLITAIKKGYTPV